MNTRSPPAINSQRSQFCQVISNAIQEEGEDLHDVAVLLRLDSGVTRNVFAIAVRKSEVGGARE